ncbi:caspase recruitment domain-containing protein 9 isoform X1 [Sciurus carolinensis]|uniref:caspase recruitment domain-containing protein 9 isoform X1 n=1 Tax=Sciurus carolinensis TaxID=30640 RepID=UPI001FB2BCD7|nr:caspase recruitment domain-containing protein 9 isoform X1 [Sciurus carolinensis]XP_047381498.1 caspase recruitment domain-containing protein 9 isoform X1 [Sciurus carolinensis]XP_047381499.1 caspase recruitment domain-containing protein 9 isoform X1 [Sciurus carolinensis]
MSDYENEEECWSTLEGFRVKLISIIDPARITPYLRQCKVLNPDDEEQVLSDPNLVIRKRKVGVLLDILQRTGHKGYVAFLESLELYYPQLYKKVTGKEPARVFSMIIDASGESGLTQLLMTEVMKLQKKVQDLSALLSSRDDFVKELQVKDGLLRTHQEQVQRLREQCEAGGRELKRCKEENYDLALRLARLSEEKGAALMRSRDLQLEVDQLRHSLMKAEDDCKVERKHTLKLRHAMEQRPSQELLWELQQEKALLQARVRELEASSQEGKLDRNSPYIQVLEEDWRQALRDHQEQTNTIFSLRKDLRQVEALRTRCMEERELFELQCLALRKDSRMYKDRIEAVLQQMEEVAIERDQAMASREELHTQCARSLQEKDELRRRVRELSEKADELQLQLFQCESRLLATEGRLKQQPPDMSSDLEDGSPRNSQELSLPQDVEEDVQLSDRGEQAIWAPAPLVQPPWSRGLLVPRALAINLLPVSSVFTPHSTDRDTEAWGCYQVKDAQRTENLIQTLGPAGRVHGPLRTGPPMGSGCRAPTLVGPGNSEWNRASPPCAHRASSCSGRHSAHRKPASRLRRPETGMGLHAG